MPDASGPAKKDKNSPLWLKKVEKIEITLPLRCRSILQCKRYFLCFTKALLLLTRDIVLVYV